MNALWLNNIFKYKQLPIPLKTIEVIINLKIQGQGFLLKKYKIKPFDSSPVLFANEQDLLLFEARAAKYFWGKFNNLLPEEYFEGRKPHSKDIANQLLDIGYHHLAGKVKKVLVKYNIPTELGLFHKARSMKSEPLVYDLMEMFRSDVVDTEVLKFLRSKKTVVKELNNKSISIFLNRVNKRCERRFYLKSFKICHTYNYYIELQILKFIKAVNKREIFEPIDLPRRHDMRCPKNLTAVNENAINSTGTSTLK